MRIALDGAGDQGGEKADEHGVVQQIGFHLAAALEYIDGVAEGGKGKVAQPQGGNQVEGVGLQLLSEQPGQIDDAQIKQIPVFVEQQNAQGGEDGRQQKQDSHHLVFAVADGKTAGPGHHSGSQQHRDQSAIFRRIAEKRIAGDEQEIGPRHTGQGIVQHRHRSEKAEIQKGSY